MRRSKLVTFKVNRECKAGQIAQMLGQLPRLLPVFLVRSFVLTLASVVSVRTTSCKQVPARAFRWFEVLGQLLYLTFQTVS